MIDYFKKLRKRVRKRLKHGGTARRCPLCGHGSKAFLEFGIVPRQDARCPFCGSLERHRLFWIFLQSKTLFFKDLPKRALHVAPEPVIEQHFRKLLGDRYTTADLFAEGVDVRMDITDIQFPDETFDFIYCSHVLEHVPDDRKAMREFRRVLTSDGFAILLVPISVDKTIEDPTVEDPAERLRLFGQEDHVRRYGPDYEGRLREEGFKVESFEPGDLLTPEEVTRYAVARAGAIFVCRK